MVEWTMDTGLQVGLQVHVGLQGTVILYTNYGSTVQAPYKFHRTNTVPVQTPYRHSMYSVHALYVCTLYIPERSDESMT